MSSAVPRQSDFLDRMVSAVERVRRRLLRAAAALEEAGVKYAVIGGNAVAAWVARVEPDAVRNTQDVDILLRRPDLDRAAAALVSAGFMRRRVAGVEMFLDGAGPRDAVHVVFAGERVRPDHVTPAPDIDDAEKPDVFRVISLPALVRMKLAAFQRKDQVHLLDLIDVGLVDQSWPAKLPKELAGRLQELLDDSER
ncbi:MAG: hypothetical protein ACREIT_06875 [Tepidisphaeraceae bacterium]